MVVAILVYGFHTDGRSCAVTGIRKRHLGPEAGQVMWCGNAIQSVSICGQSPREGQCLVTAWLRRGLGESVTGYAHSDDQHRDQTIKPKHEPESGSAENTCLHVAGLFGSVLG